ncbi:DUF3892 domain-containing protein [Galbitalea soli]|uniref:DUF3892 domain-containing protein n=1 Tax=Galbitalea soli TaxID=1268042 RepID=A0A7C9TR48_9MICO|nr:DUF3892 domain-containing protein [Galbitalea soli]
MTSYTVTKVRKQLSSDRSHRHIEGVITATGLYYSRSQVVNSINAGDTWSTSAGGYTATIRTAISCPRANCFAAPYIRTAPDSTKLDNLENLPEG